MCVRGRGLTCRPCVFVSCPTLTPACFPHSLLQPYGASPGFGKEPAPPVAVWKGHSFNTISGREAEKFSGKDSGKGDSDFNDSDSDVSGDALKKDLINHMQSGEDSSFLPNSAFLLSLRFCNSLSSQSPFPDPLPLSHFFLSLSSGFRPASNMNFKMPSRGSSTT